MYRHNLLFNKIEEVRIKYNLFGKNDKILICLSGGADSTALLVSVCEFYPDIEVYACHVNHSLRGDESDADECFAKALSEKLGVKFFSTKIDVNSHAKELGISTELAARNLRYSYFEKICKENGISLVATAHTASDNAETVIFNLARGTGLSGLSGIPPIRSLSNGINIIRPLIFASRSDIEDYLTFKNQTYVTDSSNLTDDYTRNHIRHNIIPELKKINASLEETIKNSCTLFRETQIFIDQTANNSMTDSIEKLSQYPDALRKNIVMKLYKGYSGDTLIEAKHIDKICSLIVSASDNLSKSYEVCLPSRISAHIKDGKLYFCPTVREKEKAEPYSIVIHDGFTEISGTHFLIYSETLSSSLPVKPDDISDLPSGFELYDTVILDKSKIDGAIVARSRQNGDTVKSCGNTKKIKELFNHKKIPVELRDKLPILCDKSGILYIPRVVTSDTHKKAVDASEKLRILIYSASL